MADIEIHGLDKLTVKIQTLAQLRAVKTALRAAALHVKGKIAKYPKSTQANQPGQKRWYERGYGPRWTRADGSIGGSKTSETLGRRWGIAEQNSGLTQIIGNNASYAPFVQDRDKQAWFHTINGWTTAQDVIETETPVIMGFIQDEIDKVLGD